MNKVRYNLKNIHYAKLTMGEDGAPGYTAPVHIPGAVSLTLSAEGGQSDYYADGIKYFVTTANNGYSGDLEMALIPADFLTGILGLTVDPKDKVLVENANSKAVQFAMLFEFDGDEKSIRHILYNCTATRPSTDGKTNTEKREIATEKLSLTAAPLPDGLVKAQTGPETSAAAYTDWYKSVWMPSAAVPPAEG